MQPVISVIIPLYNGQNYITKCLDSIISQGYSPLEIIIVNDSSTDNSINIILEYAKNHDILVNDIDLTDKQINKTVISKIDNKIEFTLVHQKNQGQGAARNTGISQASGKYLMFVDQDDTLEPGIIVQMAELIESRQADIVSAGYRRVTAQGKTLQEVRLQQSDWSKYKVIAPWSKLYRTDFIIKNSVLFLPVVLGEDIYFMMKAYSYKPEVAFLENIGYNWLVNESSVSNTAHKELADNTSLLSLYDMLEKIENSKVLKQDRLYEYFLIKTAVWDILYTARNNSYLKVLRNNEMIWGWFDKYLDTYSDNPYIRLNKPKGESISIRFIVWGYMKIKKLNLEKVFLKIMSKKH